LVNVIGIEVPGEGDVLVPSLDETTALGSLATRAASGIVATATSPNLYRAARRTATT
jgi:hypothetical protein